MPRLVTNADLLKRGARLKDGRPVDELKRDEPAAVEPEPSPVVAAPTIDARPMAEAVDRLASTLGEAMTAQAAMLRTVVANSERRTAPLAWEFRVTSRDGDGRIERISARAGE